MKSSESTRTNQVAVSFTFRYLPAVNAGTQSISVTSNVFHIGSVPLCDNTWFVIPPVGNVSFQDKDNETICFLSISVMYHQISLTTSAITIPSVGKVTEACI